MRKGRRRDVVAELEGSHHGHPQRQQQVGRLERAVREVGRQLDLPRGVVGAELRDGRLEAEGCLVLPADVEELFDLPGLPAGLHHHQGDGGQKGVEEGLGLGELPWWWVGWLIDGGVGWGGLVSDWPAVVGLGGLVSSISVFFFA